MSQNASHQDNNTITPHLIGTTIDGRFHLDELLKDGPMGTVYLATQTSIDRQVILKILHKHQLSDDVNLQRFLQEAKIISNLTHPNIVSLLDFGQTDEMLFLAMEYLQGITLQEILKDQRLEIDLALEVIYQICGALSETHQHNIIHRDLKPENIMLVPMADGSVQVKVLDFGLARALGTGKRATAAGIICGTPAYMAPEQAEEGDVEPRTDLYALGVILYEMLCGYVPFDAETTIKVILQQIQKQPTPLSTFVDDLPKSVDDLTMRLLSKAPEQRPNDAVETRRLLEDLMDELRTRRIRVLTDGELDARFAKWTQPSSQTAYSALVFDSEVVDTAAPTLSIASQSEPAQPEAQVSTPPALPKIKADETPAAATTEAPSQEVTEEVAEEVVETTKDTPEHQEEQSRTSKPTLHMFTVPKDIKEAAQEQLKPSPPKLSTLQPPEETKPAEVAEQAAPVEETKPTTPNPQESSHKTLIGMQALSLPITSEASEAKADDQNNNEEAPDEKPKLSTPPTLSLAAASTPIEAPEARKEQDTPQPETTQQPQENQEVEEVQQKTTPAQPPSLPTPAATPVVEEAQEEPPTQPTIVIAPELQQAPAIDEPAPPVETPNTSPTKQPEEQEQLGDEAFFDGPVEPAFDADHIFVDEDYKQPKSKGLLIVPVLVVLVLLVGGGIYALVKSDIGKKKPKAPDALVAKTTTAPTKVEQPTQPTAPATTSDESPTKDTETQAPDKTTDAPEVKNTPPVEDKTLPVAQKPIEAPTKETPSAKAPVEEPPAAKTEAPKKKRSTRRKRRKRSEPVEPVKFTQVEAPKPVKKAAPAKKTTKKPKKKNKKLQRNLDWLRNR